MYKRENALKEWLATIIKQEFSLMALTGDASFRRYYRVHYQGISLIVMDAPPDKEALQPFIAMAKLLAAGGVCVPQIMAINLEEGFLLLNDLGDKLLLNVLTPVSATQYYLDALRTLQQIQCCAPPTMLPVFDKSFMLQEMQLFPDWFLQAYLGLTLTPDEIELLQHTMIWLTTEISQQPLALIHRDYHSRNLMLTPEGKIAVIDFQDAMKGPIAYDLVSLLKDCYIAWPRNQVLQWLATFYQQNEQCQYVSFEAFTRAFDLCGMQRHLKVLGIFCRLHLRDNKPGYLKDLPLTLKYVLECAAIYPELHSLQHFMQTRVYLP